MKNINSVLLAGIFFFMAIIFAGAGFYLNSKPDWLVKSDMKHYNQGIARYKADFLPEASDSFGRAIFESDNQKIKSWSFYNLGTMTGERALTEDVPPQVRLELIDQAINKLIEAIRSDPSDDEAKYNLEFLIKKKKEIMKEVLEEMKDYFEYYLPTGYSPGQGRKGY